MSESIGPSCAWVRANVDDRDDSARIIDATLEHGGGIDVLVNNAGNRYAAPLAEIEEDQVAAMYQTNVTSPIMLSQLALPHLAERKVAIVFGLITPLRRSGGAEEVAKAIEYLAYSEWTTGAILDVDGGLGLGTLDLNKGEKMMADRSEEHLTLGAGR